MYLYINSPIAFHRQYMNLTTLTMFASTFYFHPPGGCVSSLRRAFVFVEATYVGADGRSFYVLWLTRGDRCNLICARDATSGISTIDGTYVAAVMCCLSAQPAFTCVR
jgi:hypothetical protein